MVRTLAAGCVCLLLAVCGVRPTPTTGGGVPRSAQTLHRAAAVHCLSLAGVPLSALFADRALASVDTLPSDEFSIDFATDYLGLVLGEEAYKKAVRLVVRDVKADAEAAPFASRVKGAVVLSIGDKEVEGLSLRSLDIGALVKSAPRPLTIRFRDTGAFFQRLNGSVGVNGVSTVARTTEDTRVITSVVRPASGPRPAEVVRVEVTHRPEQCTRSAAAGDVLEIAYSMSLPSGALLSSSGSSSRADGNYFFVLGGAAEDPFPQGWDYALFGMCVGEMRAVVNPPSLGFGARGSDEYGVPPESNIEYKVSLVSINGSRTP